MDVTPLKIPEVLLVTPKRHGDNRGYFSEVYNRERFVASGIPQVFVQDNESLSAAVATVRGLHFQTPPFAQDKLVRVTQGRILDVAVDIRVGSPTYGQWVAAELTADGGEQLLVPIGFAHGFSTLEPDCKILYKVSAHYSKPHDGGIAWDDPDLAIDWRLGGAAPVLSDNDRNRLRLKDFDSPFQYTPAA